MVSGQAIPDLTDEMVERTFKVNSIALISLTRMVLPQMIANKRGHIVTVASLAGMTGCNKLSDYCASKSAAITFEESLRMELYANGHSKYVKTTCVCPYITGTKMFDGATAAFPFKILEPRVVSDRIVTAMLQEEQLVIIPWMGNVLCIVHLLPISV